MTGDDYGLRVDTAFRSSIVIVARNRSPEWRENGEKAQMLATRFKEEQEN